MTAQEVLAIYPKGRGCYAPIGVDWNETTPVYLTLEDALRAGCAEVYNCEVVPEKDRPVPHCNGVSLTRYQRDLRSQWRRLQRGENGY